MLCHVPASCPPARRSPGSMGWGRRGASVTDHARPSCWMRNGWVALDWVCSKEWPVQRRRMLRRGCRGSIVTRSWSSAIRRVEPAANRRDGIDVGGEHPASSAARRRLIDRLVRDHISAIGAIARVEPVPPELVIATNRRRDALAAQAISIVSGEHVDRFMRCCDAATEAFSMSAVILSEGLPVFMTTGNRAACFQRESAVSRQSQPSRAIGLRSVGRPGI